jgi:prephenate dehydrogenase
VFFVPLRSYLCGFSSCAFEDILMGEAGFTPFDCVAIVGVGLMGGSLGLALRAGGLAKRVIGIDREREVLRAAQERGAIDVGTTELGAGLREADCVALAAPIGAIPSLLEALAPLVSREALITDLGSVKARIVEAGTRWFGPRFVGGHPMAGSERSGIGAARPDLFTGAAWGLVRPAPFSLAEDAPVSRLADLVTALGARPIPLDAALHDRLVALVSHLPHALSFAFAHTIAASESPLQARDLAGGSFRDLIRVSESDPSLWCDILLDNRAALLEALAAYETRLQILKQALETADPSALRNALDTNTEMSRK